MAPIGFRSIALRSNRRPFSAACVGRMAFAIPPPRFVSTSSRSELRNVSVFSAKGSGVERGCGAGAAVGDGNGRTLGAGATLAEAIAGEAFGELFAGGKECVVM